MMNENDESTTVTSFFQALAERAHKENDLSDVTYAMCRSDAAFLKFFLDFFFKDAKLEIDNIRSLEREHSDAIGRPDFWIETKDGELYIVEVKIGDWNQHFDQYYNLLKEHRVKQYDDVVGAKNCWSHLGYIANYRVTTTENGRPVDRNCNVRTWQEFKSALEKCDSCKNAMVLAYVQYLQSVCHFHEVNLPANWRLLGSDFRFFRELITRIGSAIRENDCQVYSGSKRNFASQWCFGEFFWLTNFGKVDTSARGWFGAFYAEGGINLCVEFEDRQGWGKSVCDKFRRDEKMEEDALRFWIGKKVGDKIDKINLNEFFSKVISIVKGCDSLHSEQIGSDIGFAESEAKCFSEKKNCCVQYLSAAIESSFVTAEFKKELKENGYTIELRDMGNAEQQDSHCGKDYVLRPINWQKKRRRHSKSLEIEGWLGVMFKSGGGANKNARGEDLRECPTFVVEMDAQHIMGQVSERTGEGGWYIDDFEFACHDIYIDKGLDYNDVFNQAREAILGALKGCRKGAATLDQGNKQL